MYIISGWKNKVSSVIADVCLVKEKKLFLSFFNELLDVFQSCWYHLVYIITHPLQRWRNFTVIFPRGISTRDVNVMANSTTISNPRIWKKHSLKVITPRVRFPQYNFLHVSGFSGSARPDIKIHGVKNQEEKKGPRRRFITFSFHHISYIELHIWDSFDIRVCIFEELRSAHWDKTQFLSKNSVILRFRKASLWNLRFWD